jgi:uncharacterized damage-inducible protein DinB
MKISETLLPEFDHEMATTRKLLERIPEDKLAWKPHEKSMSLSRLAGHMAEMPGYAIFTMQQDSLDVRPEGGRAFEPLVATSRAQVLEAFDKNVAAGRAAIAAGSDEDMAKPWTLLAGGHTVFQMPKVAVLRTMMLSHIIHHRGQMSVYLRLNEVPVPSIYGPSADEGAMGAGAS